MVLPIIPPWKHHSNSICSIQTVYIFLLKYLLICIICLRFVYSFIVDIFNVQGKSSIYTSFPSRHGRLKSSYIQISKLYTICTDKRSYSIFIFVFGCIYVIIILHALHFILNSYIATLHPTVALFHFNLPSPATLLLSSDDPLPDIFLSS